MLRFVFIIFISLIINSCGYFNESVSPSNPYGDDYTQIASISHRNKWNGANVHDPSCIKVGDTYYLYSTDAYYIPPNINFRDDSTIQIGHIPVRSSKDLLNWKFEGWAFENIPKDAFQYVKEVNKGNAPEGVWAPFIQKVDEEYRLYYSVSYFGTNGSCIGLAISNSPLGPWEDKGIVLKSDYDCRMNAIDPSVIIDQTTGKNWMVYGSYFDGIYCVELNRFTGFILKQGDLGECIAQRENGTENTIEGPELFYNEEFKMYYLFVSYDPLFSSYNIRVGRSKTPNGPFVDFFGHDLKEKMNNYPILTNSYKFDNHPGWSGNAHCSIVKGEEKYFVLHQGRLAPSNLMMQLHCREIKWLKDGWPVFSPERYNLVELKTRFTIKDLSGKWELVELKDIPKQVELSQGQIPPGGWTYSPKVFNLSRKVEFVGNELIKDGNVSLFSSCHVDKDNLYITDIDGKVVECKLFSGWDWENECETILFSGILTNGHGIWGKKLQTN